MAYPKLTDKSGAIATAAAVRRGDRTPLQTVEHAIARIEKLDAHINAVVATDFERARAIAAAMGTKPGRDQPLFGVPMTVKESFDVAGLPTTLGHVEYKDNIAERDSVVVQRLKAAGAIILGKTNVSTDLADATAENPLYGRTNNPHDPSRIPGGSSGGAAAAVAAGMVPCDFGSDSAAAIRNPAHFTGIWGHKSSYGLISRRRHLALDGSSEFHTPLLSSLGPLARDPDDLALLLEITADFPLARRPKPLAELRLLAIMDHPVSELDAGVRGPIEAALAAMEQAGAHIARTCDLIPNLTKQHLDFLRVLSVTLAHGRPGSEGQTLTLCEWFDLLDRQTRCEYAWSELFERYDFVLAPAFSFLAPPHDSTPIRERRVTINGEDAAFTDAFAWAGLASFPNLPSTVLPVGASGGLPCGMQVIGPRWSDFDCIAAAKAIGEVLHG